MMESFKLLDPCMIKTENELVSQGSHVITGGNRNSLGHAHLTISVAEPLRLEQVRKIQLGESFYSFADVTRAVRKYELKNKINLNQKYFRRIAANPKPSNKEDYMLTEEERKRLVYRWVDFCCTYFDELLHTRTDLSSDHTAQPLPVFKLKECPVRIRFQMRPKEKDLVVSIFREQHDHDPPPEYNEEAQPAKKRSSQQNKLNLRPPPALAPFPNATSKAKGCADVASPLTTDNATRSQHSLPRPPPLKMGNSSACSNITRPCGISAESIVKNIYNYLSVTHLQGSNMLNGIVFTSPRPNLIKLTADLAGLDEGVVTQIIAADHLNLTPNVTPADNSQCKISNSSNVQTTRPTSKSFSNPFKRKPPVMNTAIPANSRSSNSIRSEPKYSQKSKVVARNTNTRSPEITNIVIKAEPFDYFIDEYDTG